MKKNLLILLFLIICLNAYGAKKYPPNYLNHNKVNTCKNLLQKYTLDQLSAMISSGNFDDIYVGDYIEMEMTSDYGTEKVRWLVAGINLFYGKLTGSSSVFDNHIVLVAEDSFKTTHKMNPTNDNTGGFYGSEMFTNILPKYNTAIINAFGANHVVGYNQDLSSSTSSTVPSMCGNGYAGASDGRILASATLCLLSEPQLMGTLACSSSYLDIGINNFQFPIFAQMPELIYCHAGFNGSNRNVIRFWLSAVSNNGNFVNIYNYGRPSVDGASNALGVRPYFIFK